MKGFEMSVYHDIFSSWSDVQREFDMNSPEPDEVLFAAYEYENYSGECFVVYKQNEKLWMVEGGHCSCYGLEGQWEPEEMTIGALRSIVEAANHEDLWMDGLKVRHKDALFKMCERLEMQ